MAEPRKKAKPFRLPAHVRPERYALHVQLDPTRSKRYRGSVRIELTLARAIDVIELHAVDLTVRAPKLTAQGKTLRCKVVAVAAHESVRIALPKRVPAGNAVLELQFSGTLRSDLRGLYYAKSGERAYAFTQLEAADARRFFPCFDEPSFKARFAIEVTAPEKLSVVSNGAIQKRARHADGTQHVVFEETPLLSTYLVALGVGELDASKTARAGKVPIRILHAPGNAKLTAFALEAARECLVRLEEYFGVPYPYSKLDLVAVPDFEMGAMENAGAVFFRETLLLVDASRATLPEKKRAIEVICHELAHMWYGNLVTMAWWDDLWLNEAFATWMAFEIVHAWRPELRMWNDFGHSRASAFELDALRTTHAIYTDVPSAAEATESFDLITYEKGAAVIRMLERYLGRERFRAGVRDYIREHAEKNTRAQDLWRALEAHAGDDVGAVVRPWIERPGFPVVSLDASSRRGKLHVRLRQQRFAAGGKPARKGEKPWPVPMVLRDVSEHGGGEQRMLLSTATGELTVPHTTRLHAPVLYGNADEGGFYHPLHDDESFAALLSSLTALDAAERLGLVTHTWALAQSGHTSLTRFIDLALALHAERDPDVVSALSWPLAVLLDRVAPKAAADSIRDALTARYLPTLDAIGWKSRPREPVESSLLRSELFELLGGVAEAPVVLEQAAQLGARYLDKPGSVEPNLGGTALMLAARTADLRLHARYLDHSKSAATPQERRRFRMALAEARDVRCITRTLELCLTEHIPTQDVAIVLIRLCENPAARATTFAFAGQHWDKLRARLTPALAGRFVEGSRALQTDVRPAQLLAFFRKAALPGTGRALSQLQERLALDAKLAERARRELVTQA